MLDLGDHFKIDYFLDIMVCMTIEVLMRPSYSNLLQKNLVMHKVRYVYILDIILTKTLIRYTNAKPRLKAELKRKEVKSLGTFTPKSQSS